jgi:hypothetical protein
MNNLIAEHSAYHWEYHHGMVRSHEVLENNGLNMDCVTFLA